jgi:hypothetical protein
MEEDVAGKGSCQLASYAVNFCKNLNFLLDKHPGFVHFFLECRQVKNEDLTLFISFTSKKEGDDMRRFFSALLVLALVAAGIPCGSEDLKDEGG